MPAGHPNVSRTLTARVTRRLRVRDVRWVVRWLPYASRPPDVRFGEGAYPEWVARWTETWLSGPSATLGTTAEPPKWPGEKLGLPEEGVGAVAGGGRRLVALLLDLFAASLITAIFVRPDYQQVDVMQTYNYASILVWVLLTVPATAFFGFTPGMGAVGVRVGRLDGAGSVGLWRAAVRCLLTFVLIPPLVRNVDGRGVHDRLTGTVVVRMR